MIRVTAKQAQALGVLPKAKRRRKEATAAKVVLTLEQKLFDAAAVAHGLPVPDHEYPFAKEIGRNWRVDHIFDGWLVLEVECSPFAGKPCPYCKRRPGGRHNHGKGFLEDIIKYNELTIMGYSLIRCTRDDIEKGTVWPLVRRALDAGPP